MGVTMWEIILINQLVKHMVDVGDHIDKPNQLTYTVQISALTYWWMLRLSNI